MTQPDRTTARRLAQESLAKGDATGWFDALYTHAQGDEAQIPWADMRPNASLTAWLARRAATTEKQRALVIGCGLGDDAEALAALGCRVTAFDVSASAIDWCRKRFPRTRVDYSVADVLNLPTAWHSTFDLVVEIYTLQVLPPELRQMAMAQMAQCVAPGGTLLLIARGREPTEERGTMPWPLDRDELAYFSQCGLEATSFEDFFDDEDPPVRRFRVEHRRAP
jgi:SAM-dependent methyltransferase